MTVSERNLKKKIAPTLTPRNKESLIADLGSTHASKLQRKSNEVAKKIGPALDASKALETNQENINDDSSEEDSQDEHGESQLEDSKPDNSANKSEALKVSERKRMQNAIAADFVKTVNKKHVKAENKIQIEDVSSHSTRWLVNQSENRKIISTPREYQTELYNLAKEKNVIAVLDTGSGKTLIAVLLLRYVITQELEDRFKGRKKRISFFLVDSVQLVFQQHAVLKANLDSPMDMFCGDMGCDLWSKELWEKHYLENEIIVCTAEVLRQCLHHSFIRIQDINLLIFDEAHHAKKDHSYARIIKDFYANQPSSALLPKIFGMTASPVDARVDVKKAATELEAILHSQIVTSRDAGLLKTKTSNNGRSELLGTYAPLLPKFKTELYHQMNQCFSQNHILKKPLRFSYEASRELGAWCSDQVWVFCLTGDETRKLLAREERLNNTVIEDQSELMEKSKSQIEVAIEIIRKYNFDPPDFSDERSWSKNLSSKVVLLIRYLRERYERETTDKCIVFVKQRYTARILARLFEQDEIRTNWLHVGTLIGAQNGNYGDLNTSFREQVLTLMKFRQGKINCLFATSVAEEGLDVPDCNLVIRFDLYDTLIQHIQSRGRARHPNSKYIHLCEAGNKDHQNVIMEARKNEGILRQFCDMLPEDRILQGNDITLDDILAKEKYNRTLIIPETGAQLNYKMSLVVLSNFVNKLPNNGEENLQVEYVMTYQAGKFQCEAILPVSSPVQGAIGEWSTTKRMAKCSAAFETCINLLEGKYLDRWLIPTYAKKVLPAMRNAKLALDPHKKSAYAMITKPEIWSAAGTAGILHTNVLYLEKPGVTDRPVQPIALLTKQELPQLPSFILHFGIGRYSPVFCKPFGTIPVNTKLIEQLNTFTLCIFDDVFSKGYESNPDKMPYFLAPVNDDLNFADMDIDPTCLVNWNMVEYIFNYQEKWSNDIWSNLAWKNETDDFFVDKFIVDPYDGSRKLWSIGVAKEYKPLDPVPPNTATRKGSRKNNDNIMEYSCSLWAKARSRRNFDPSQRVIKAEYISLRRNHLDEFDNQNQDKQTQCFIILEPLKISPLPARVVAMAYIFPAIIHRIESYLIALDACKLLHLEIKPELALEALTKDFDMPQQNNTDRIQFQRGMGSNYERLEFLGDCFLKMATSISLHGLLPQDNEFRCHVNRMLLTSNKNLMDNSIKLKLFEYIRSQSFNRRAWYPEGLVVLRGKAGKASNSQELADKTIADVCEAMIGAALLTFHESKNMDMAVRAVTELVCSEYHSVTSFAEYYELYTKPDYLNQPPNQKEIQLASSTEKQHPYKFQNPRLLSSAFTHPSFPRSFNGKIPSYQRLEFLGDALLDMVCINHLFHNFPGKDPQWLTEHKMAMVSNMFLGALCVQLGFNRHLLIWNSSFMQNINDYVIEVTEARAQAEKDAIDAGKSPEDCAPDYWMSVHQPPKCLPDIVEAYIGAIFVDSKYDFSEVERFFESHIAWFFRDMSVYDTFARNHPTTFLSQFLESNMRCHAWSMKVGEVLSVDGDKSSVLVMVIIHNTVITHAVAESSRQAKIIAAKNALEILGVMDSQEFRVKYECNCHAN